MSKTPSVIFIYGDRFLSQKLITRAKNKELDARWVTFFASGDLNEIRAEVGTSPWDDSKKFVVIEDLPNQKEVREFLQDLVISFPPTNKVIIWDSTSAIKLDPKTGFPNKTWGDFINDFQQLPNVKIINNGVVLDEKNPDATADFIKQKFEQNGKQIAPNEIQLLVKIVGHGKGLLDSEIDKLCIQCPSPIPAKYILSHAFPTAKESLLYKLGDALDTASYKEAAYAIELFLHSGENENRIAETFVNKARWQMLAAYYWAGGLEWYEIAGKLMQSCKFPSTIWHNSELTERDKKKEADIFQLEEQAQALATSKLGIDPRWFKKNKTKSKNSAKIKKGPSLPMPFIAERVVFFVRDKIVSANSANIQNVAELKEKVLDRTIRIYLYQQKKLAEVRYGKNPIQDLQEMAKILTDVQL